MMQVGVLADGRLHLNHGPMDLICQVWGPGRAGAYDRAVARFDGLLEELVSELPSLRAEQSLVHGAVAQVMAAAVAPFRPAFITPMAAVAGAVAEAVLVAIVAGPGVERAYVNNGGDIAVHLASGQRLHCAMASGGMVELRAEEVARGIATSGWRGRSWSLGIADAVTVVARTAAMADAAATMIANAVDLPGHPAVTRRPAVEMQADSDLGPRLVTVGVAALTRAEVARALDRGLAAARGYRARGLIEGAALFLQGEVVTEGDLRLKELDHV
ncbi:UPF0280 family protein [Fuscibacter oryzae]|uniref:UPF0280 family protein n=1 Tax=Fuscibacter oryzae TaxID=2803939 RepID=A0A8J7MTA5_9RHOB|nr:UPF0280 family protein [Fuscibacter oryzae]MBL4929186.1 UPF0280 family protein [Fuscibacter oryzae]